ncbi:MAG TPA: 30S ribosomal protein S11, partial [Spirochaetota bacterium]|nr:30S ribosomal protein S11 [Spirochaetota bacterium]
MVRYIFPCSPVLTLCVVLAVTKIKDVTPIPHNGCRPPKRQPLCGIGVT